MRTYPLLLAAIVAISIVPIMSVNRPLYAADKVVEKGDGEPKDKKKGKSKDAKDAPDGASATLIEQEGTFTATKAMEKWVRFQTTARTVRITWSAGANAEGNDHSATFLRLVLMQEIGFNENIKQKSWKQVGVITARASAGEGHAGTLDLAPNNYAVVASGSNIGYRVKVEQIVK